MGLKPVEVKALTLKEFNLMYTGFYKREEKEWNRTRHVMAYVLNYGGMGAKQFHTPQQIWPLELDAEHVKKAITTKHQASELLKSMYGSFGV